jgi:hypothetical protein
MISRTSAAAPRVGVVGIFGAGAPRTTASAGARRIGRAIPTTRTPRYADSPSGGSPRLFGPSIRRATRPVRHQRGVSSFSFTSSRWHGASYTCADTIRGVVIALRALRDGFARNPVSFPPGTRSHPNNEENPDPPWSSVLSHDYLARPFVDGSLVRQDYQARRIEG